MPEGISVAGEKMQQWVGSTVIGDEEKEFTDHAELVAAVAKAKAIEVNENAYSVTNVNLSSGAPEGIYYFNTWNNPTEEEQESDLEMNGFVSAIGSFTVAYMNDL